MYVRSGTKESEVVQRVGVKRRETQNTHERNYRNGCGGETVTRMQIK